MQKVAELTEKEADYQSKMELLATTETELAKTTERLQNGNEF